MFLLQWVSTAGSLSQVLKKGNEPGNASFSHLPWKFNLHPDPFAELKVGISWKLSTVHSLKKMLSVLFGVYTNTRTPVRVKCSLNSVDDSGLSTVQLHQSFGEVQPKDGPDSGSLIRKTCSRSCVFVCCICAACTESYSEWIHLIDLSLNWKHFVIMCKKKSIFFSQSAFIIW